MSVGTLLWAAAKCQRCRCKIPPVIQSLMKAVIGKWWLTLCLTNLPLVPNSSSTFKVSYLFHQHCPAPVSWATRNPIYTVYSIVRVWREEKYKLAVITFHNRDLHNTETYLAQCVVSVCPLFFLKKKYRGSFDAQQDNKSSSLKRKNITRYRGTSGWSGGYLQPDNSGFYKHPPCRGVLGQNTQCPN